MKVQCNFCGNWIEEHDQKCPNCGATNERYRRVSNDVPTTIAELKKWAKVHRLPLADMRTYIGVDYKGAKAFGIYKDEKTGNFVVYKNKADGSRSIRYEGPDETYAVNELYLKMKERVTEQKAIQRTKRAAAEAPGRSKREKGSSGLLGIYRKCIYFIMALLVILSVFALVADDSPSIGYYNYGDSTYYYQESDHSWYEYDYDIGEWESAAPSTAFVESPYEYYTGYGYSSDAVYSDFTESPYYTVADDKWEADDDWDADMDWDTGSDWDTSYDDWDSDW